MVRGHEQTLCQFSNGIDIMTWICFSSRHLLRRGVSRRACIARAHIERLFPYFQGNSKVAQSRTVEIAVGQQDIRCRDIAMYETSRVHDTYRLQHGCDQG